MVKIEKKKVNSRVNIIEKRQLKDIPQKINEYKKILNKKLLSALTEEKKKDEERQRVFSQASNAGKKSLNRVFSIERIQSSQKIASLNK